MRTDGIVHCIRNCDISDENSYCIQLLIDPRNRAAGFHTYLIRDCFADADYCAAMLLLCAI